MSEDESIFEVEPIHEEEEEEVAKKEEVVVAIKKKKKRNRTYTPEQRERMLANLKKGREASLKKRRAKKEIKKEIKQNNRKVANDYVNEKLASETRLVSKIDRLEAMILKMNTAASKTSPKPAPVVEKIKPKPATIAKSPPAPQEYVTLSQIQRRMPKSQPKPKPKPTPVAKVKPISRRNISTYKRRNKFGL